MKIKNLIITLLLSCGLLNSVFADSNINISTTGVQGYDLVSYQTGKRPLKGNGHFTSNHDGVTYLFINEANKNIFDASPEKYLPAYGGYCAYGVSVGKKFIGDPEVWRVVDGKLYLNLDVTIQETWLSDVPGKIQTANRNWRKIKNIPVAQL